MTEEFKIGDIVRLKSGGPKMTVTEMYPDVATRKPLVKCTWFYGREGDQGMKGGEFPPEALERA